MRSSVFEGKITTDTQRRKRQKTKHMAQRFKKTNPKNRFPIEKVNGEKFIFLEKPIVGKLSKSAMALYIAICSQANFEKNDWFFVSQEDLSKMTGLSVRQVRKTTRELIARKLLKRKKVTKSKLHYYTYKVDFIRRGMVEGMKNEFFKFFTSIVDSGTWSKLKPRAKALYLALCMTSKFDSFEYFDSEYDLDGDYELHKLDKDIRGELYRNRKWEISQWPIIKLCGLVNISHQNISPVIKELEKYVLVKRYTNFFKVFLKPQIEAKTHTKT